MERNSFGKPSRKNARAGMFSGALEILRASGEGLQMGV